MFWNLNETEGFGRLKTENYYLLKDSNLWLKRQPVDEGVDDIFAVAVVGEDEPEENCQ